MAAEGRPLLITKGFVTDDIVTDDGEIPVRVDLYDGT